MMIATAAVTPMARYGRTLPRMIDQGRSGETSSASIVPVSFSLVSEIAVISEARIVRTNAINPGTKMFELSRVGLNRIRVVAAIRTGAYDKIGRASCRERSER